VAPLLNRTYRVTPAGCWAATCEEAATAVIAPPIQSLLVGFIDYSLLPYF
jgi:hypothetical protein